MASFKRMVAVIMTIITLYVPGAGSSESPEITLMLAGDVLIVGSIASAYEKSGSDAIISRELAGLFRMADIAMVNLEMPFSTRGEKAPNKDYTFRAKPEHIKLLSDMGVDVVSIANNHTLDYGRTAFLDTLTYLTKEGIGYAGGGNNAEEAAAPWVIEIQGRTVGIVCASRVVPAGSWVAKPNAPGIISAYESAPVNNAIADAKKICDFVIVYLHWGIEYQKIAAEYQREMARAYIESGADAVIGSHPHILQGFEIYNDKPIAYSLGNFIFSTSRPDPDTCAVRLSLTDNDIWLEVIPCQISKTTVSMTAEEEHIAERLRALEEISFGVRIAPDGRIYSEDTFS